MPPLRQLNLTFQPRHLSSTTRRHAAAFANIRSEPSTSSQHNSQPPQSSSSSTPSTSQKLRFPSQPITLPTPQSIHPSEPFFVQRTGSRNLPVYQSSKNGGNLKTTRIRHVSGDARVLLQLVEESLSPKPQWIKINPVTGHVEMKGWYKEQVERLLVGRGF